MRFDRLFGIVGIIIFIFLLFKSNITHIIELLFSVNAFILIGILANIPIIFFYCLRWQVLLRRIGAFVKLKSVIKIWYKGVVPAFLTPGRVGELYRAKFIKEKTGIHNAKIISTIVVDKFMDLLLLAMLSVFSFIYLIVKFDAGLSLWYLVFFVLIVFFVLFFLTNQKIIKRITNFVLVFPMPSLIKNFFQKSLKEFHKGIELIDKKTLFLAFIYTILNWSFTIIGVYFFALSLSINVNFFYILLAHPISSLLGILPITVSGIGTRDLTYVLIFGIIGLTQESAIALSFLLLIFYNLLHILIGSFVYLLGEKENHNF